MREGEGSVCQSPLTCPVPPPTVTHGWCERGRSVVYLSAEALPRRVSPEQLLGSQLAPDQRFQLCWALTKAANSHCKFC